MGVAGYPIHLIVRTIILIDRRNELCLSMMKFSALPFAMFSRSATFQSKSCN